MLDVSSKIGFETAFSSFFAGFTGVLSTGFLSAFICLDNGFETVLAPFEDVFILLSTTFSLFSFKIYTCTLLFNKTAD